MLSFGRGLMCKWQAVSPDSAVTSDFASFVQLQAVPGAKLKVGD